MFRPWEGKRAAQGHDGKWWLWAWDPRQPAAEPTSSVSTPHCHPGKVGRDRVVWPTAPGSRGGGDDEYIPTTRPVIIRNTRTSGFSPYQTLEGDGHSDTDDLTTNHSNCIQHLTSGAEWLTFLEHLPCGRQVLCLPQPVRTHAYKSRHYY